MIQPLLQAADLRGAARLTTEAVSGLTSLVEAMHARAAGDLRLTASAVASAPENTHGLTGLVYETVRGVTRVAGLSVEALLTWLGPALASMDPKQPAHAEHEAVIAALNGVLGDHLAATANPLAISMTFRHAGRALPLERFGLRGHLPGATPQLLVLLHGLCRNDLQWQRAGHDHGVALAEALDFTPVYLHYNSGLSVSTNGRILAQLMERLYDAWPVPIKRLIMLGHSMGGLVARSALHHGALAQRSRLRWPGRVNDLVCLGTPHQGAPLESVGQGIEMLLRAAPYAAPLARLAKIRSAGIKDMRLGNVVRSPASDTGLQQYEQAGLPASARCFTMAADLGRDTGGLIANFWGDGLVPVASALGHHHRSDRRLAFEVSRQAVVHETGHLELLSSARVFNQLRQWLA